MINSLLITYFAVYNLFSMHVDVVTFSLWNINTIILFNRCNIYCVLGYPTQTKIKFIIFFLAFGSNAQDVCNKTLIADNKIGLLLQNLGAMFPIAL